MTAPTPSVITDPRIGHLMELVEILIGTYMDLVSTTAGHMPKDDHGALAAHVTERMSDVRTRLTEIVTMGPGAPDSDR
ncbi:hypothetical protein [Embleya sp. NPDC001921]